MKVVLSTGNIVSGGPSIIRKPGAFRSNLELTNSLRSAFLAAKQDHAFQDPHPEHINDDGPPPPGGSGGGDDVSSSPLSSSTTSSTEALTSPTPLDAWTERDVASNTLFVPRIDWPLSEISALQEPRAAYDLTVKLFFLPLASVAERAAHAREALALVRRRLGLEPGTPIDLLILSFPGVSFPGDCEVRADRRNASQGNLEEEAATWAALEELHAAGEVAAMGLAEFGSRKLARFLDRVTVKPRVDQINIRDCCKVPAALIELAKKADIELLVHSDCSDILPGGTLRELLGHGFRGAGVLAGPEARGGGGGAGHELLTADVDGDVVGGRKLSGFAGGITPLWVVKYTAFVKDRGVVENKGYFAGAELQEET